MRALFIISYVANLLLAVASWVVLPERVATHFGPGGQADGWGRSGVHTLVMLAIHTLLFAGLALASRLTLAVPPRWVNLPNKAYWLAPERRAATAAKVRAAMDSFGTAIFLFLFLVGILALRANLATPVCLDERLLLVALGIFLLYTAVWCVGFYRGFRVPGHEQRTPNVQR